MKKRFSRQVVPSLLCFALAMMLTETSFSQGAAPATGTPAATATPGGIAGTPAAKPQPKDDPNAMGNEWMYSKHKAEVLEAKSQFEKGQFADALKTLKTAYTKDPQNISPPLLQLTSWAIRSNLANQLKGRLVRTWLNQQVKEMPNDPQAYILLATESLSTGRIPEADLLLGKAESIFLQASKPEGSKYVAGGPRAININRMYYQNRLAYHEMTKNWPAALGIVAKLEGESYGGKTAAMQLRRAKIHFLNGVLTPSDEAINTARKELAEIAAREVKDAAKLGVTLTDQNRSLPPDAIVANWYFERNDFDNASRYAAAAFKANPKSYRVADLAVQICFIQDGKLEEARKIATDYLKNNPTDPKATILLGSIDLASKNYATAEKAFRSVVAQKPKDSLFVANDRLANTLYAQYEAAADKKAALPKIQEALKLAMENVKSSKKPNPQAVSTLAWGYYISGNQEAARRNFQAIVQSGRVMPDTAYVGAKMAFQDKNLQQAANLARQAAQSKVFFLHRQDAKNLLKRISEFETADISGSGTAARGQNKTQK